MRVLLIGASGFIGSKILDLSPENITLTGTYCTNKISSENIVSLQLDILDKSLKWNEIIDGYDCIIIAARPIGFDEKSRTKVALQTSNGFLDMIDAVSNSSNPPRLVAIHGSLSYGHCGEKLISVSEKILPTGFAKSYSVGEKPFRDYLAEGNNCAIIRAPWILGPASWYSELYLKSQEIPILGNGRQWMSIVTLDSLAKSVWDAVLQPKSGIIHPKLSYRCRQEEFANLVADVSNKKIKKIGRLQLLRFEKQTRQSIIASIKLDDGNSMDSESDSNRQKILEYLKQIHSDF
ncbi:MAG: NAD(P)-dependent oxidoreductase [Candidatus Poseidoniaceae archaeon]|nr:NAD(P)-dependent oxidoreductase [Candidatus Poseidoniaceae archaeon]